MIPEEIELREYPGYRGMFTRAEMPGALRNGTRVVKVRCDPGDAHPLGSLATVLGSVAHPDTGELGYFVEWDAHPGMAVGVQGSKVAAAS